MSVHATELPVVSHRPKRADAQRNYDKLLAAAKAAFTETDAETSLEEIARRAGVGIGTLYRHFPNRRVLIEAVYVDEVSALGESARGVASLPPWEALTTWLRRFAEYAVTKQALMNELFAEGATRDSDVFARCRSSLWEAGIPLLERAQAAGVVRPDVSVEDVLFMVSGIAKVPVGDPDHIERILAVALDGLRSPSAT